jgi:hypothetical protein
MKYMMKRQALTIALLASGALCGTASAQEVGKASAVNPAATANLRTITIGSSIAHKERIQTTAAGSVLLLFLDKTSMTIGPNSDLTIDEYVYNPNAGAGKLAATLGKGALRFVGGQISHSGDAEVKTASAVIGIRGGVALITPKNVFTGYGSSTVTSGGSTVTLYAGEFTQTQGGGTPPTPPGAPPAGFVAAQIQTFQSTGGQTGGVAPGTASPAAIKRAELNATGSPTGTVAQVAPVGANGTVQVTTVSPSSTSASSTSPQNQILTTVIQSAQTSTQSTATTQIANQIVAQQLYQLQFGAAAFALTSTNCCNPNSPTSPVPYLPANFATGSNYYVSPVMGYRTASVDVANRAPFIQYGIGITGKGAAQSSWIFLASGSFADDGSGGFVEPAGLNATRRGAANFGVGLINTAAASTPGSVVVGPDKLPISATTNVNYLVPETNQYVPSTPFLNLGDGSGATTYTFIQNQSQTTVPAGLGSNRPSVTLTGWAGGLMRTFDNTTNQYVAPSFVIGGRATIVLDPNLNRVQANFNIANLTPSANQTFSYANYQFGSLDLFRAKGAYVDYNTFGARGAQISANNATGAETPVSTVNGQALNNHLGLFVNVPLPVAQQISAGVGGNVNFCQCDYTRWGFWSGSSNRTAANGDSITDIGNLMTWVAGQLPNISEVPASGTAIYDGHVIASIKNGSNEYVSAGNLTNTVNFGTRAGAVTASLDKTSYSGTVAISSSDPRNFSSTLSGDIGSRSMVLNGQFFRGVAGPVAEMGGGVQISGTNYIGSGIFAAKAR